MTDLEHRLRQALAARAAAVKPESLRFDPLPAERRTLQARWWLPLAAGAAAMAVVVLIFTAFHLRTPAPVQPAGTPPASPSPVVTETRSPTPVPSPSRPATSPSASAATASPTTTLSY